MRRFAAVLLALAVLARPSAAQPSRPRLAIIVVVDGLSWERLSTWRPWFTSGLKRLLDEGEVATACRYDHLNTETGPGHASIATGAPPRVHGVPLNEWYERSADGKTMEAIYCAQSSPSILGPGQLLVPTLGDRLTARNPKSKVVAISNKDRAAILLAGRSRQHVAYWYAAKDGTYVTSEAYDAEAPAGVAAAGVVARFNREKAGRGLEAHAGTTWSRLPVPDPAPAPGFEIGLDAYQDQIVGPVFPHELAKAKRPYPTAFLWSSFADGELTELALDLLADDSLALGRGDTPDILAVSFSANDFVSHHYGPGSVEELEILRGLDLDIGRLLDAATARFGTRSVMFALSADHGFAPLPEAAQRRDASSSALRIPEPKIRDGLNLAIDTALKRTQGPSLVYRYEACSVWLDRAALAAPGAPTATRVLSIVKNELATTFKDVVFKTFDTAAGLSSRPKDELARRASNANVPGRSGDLFVVLRSGVIIDPYDGKGSTHGSPWEYDTHVPLIFWGGGIKPSELTSPTTPYDLAPTLASWLGVRLPDATGRRIATW
jgi:hypothetical protein